MHARPSTVCVRVCRFASRACMARPGRPDPRTLWAHKPTPLLRVSVCSAELSQRLSPARAPNYTRLRFEWTALAMRIDPDPLPRARVRHKIRAAVKVACRVRSPAASSAILARFFVVVVVGRAVAKGLMRLVLKIIIMITLLHVVRT